MQCRGVAQSIAERGLAEFARKESWYDLPIPETAEIIEEVITQTRWTKLPLACQPVSNADSYLFEAPLPDLIIASGRRTIPHLRKFKRAGADKPPFIVFLKDPRFGHRFIDVVWAPSHDGINSAEAISSVLAPHALDRTALDNGKEAASLRFAEYPGPLTSIILGGDSKSVRWDNEAIEQICDQLKRLPTRGTFLVTASRRTPPELLSAISQLLKHRSHWIWDGEGNNPYVEMLALADRIVVTGDSHNMVSEVLATGAPVHVFRPPGLAKKLQAFLDGLEQSGNIHDLSKGFATEFGERLDDTDQIANSILFKYFTSQPKTVNTLWG